MKLVADLHIHSVGSGHAFSTITEIAAAAKAKGLQMVALTDHGPAISDGPHPHYFMNLRVLPKEIDGLWILKGIEANIIDEQGQLDLETRLLERLDIVLAGFHAPCFGYTEKEICTKAALNALDNPYLDILVHPGNPQFPLDYGLVVQKAAAKGIPLEINNSSFCGSRRGSVPNCHNIARLAASFGGPVVIGSDAHFAPDVGRFDSALEAVSSAGIKEEQVLNTSVEKILGYLERRRAARKTL